MNLFLKKLETIKPVIESGELQIISQNKVTVNGYDAYLTEAEGLFSSKWRKNIMYNSKKSCFITMKNIILFLYSNRRR